MWVGRATSKLTSTERQAMARLRERRATGEIPAALSHAAPHTPCELPTFSNISGRPPPRAKATRRKRFRIHRRPPPIGGTRKNRMCELGGMFSKLPCFGGETSPRHSVSTVGATKDAKARFLELINRVNALVKGSTDVNFDDESVDCTEKKRRQSGGAGGVGVGVGGGGGLKKNRLGSLMKSFRTAPMVNFDDTRVSGKEDKGSHISDDAYFQSLLASS